MELPPVDWENPPLDPPDGVAQPLMWRLAARLLHDHVTAAGSWPVARCRVCELAWPCPARRYAERGLLAACRHPVTGRGAAAFTDWFLAADEPPRGAR
ncbi:hypothetical protein Cs7R123_23280 [Catellatospora sp. TT07R-123]|uniref:hypothetical protein n=1 Tax=Catellatospora sp. TT07R-123 TaxID=2733863 RepID=UPI001B0A116D|nr:hypothetical protein [Catellatospora sp. TT07R-123]GHJ44986.1 hypothetical protein Cs7R123_23280 [Catellatospora sp. TT07R-123]